MRGLRAGKARTLKISRAKSLPAIEKVPGVHTIRAKQPAWVKKQKQLTVKAKQPAWEKKQQQLSTKTPAKRSRV